MTNHDTHYPAELAQLDLRARKLRAEYLRSFFARWRRA